MARVDRSVKFRRVLRWKTMPNSTEHSYKRRQQLRSKTVAFEKCHISRCLPVVVQ